MRLADAPQEIKQLLSLRKDTLSHAYELLKVEEPKKRRRLAEQVARGELSLVKLRERVEGRPPREVSIDKDPAEETVDSDEPAEMEEPAATPLAEDSLMAAKTMLAEALDELSAVLRSQATIREIDPTDRQNLAKYLTIAKLRLENAIAQVRSGDSLRT